MSTQDDEKKTVVRGVYTGLMAALGEAADLLPRLQGPDRQQLKRVLDQLEALRPLALCLSKLGDTDPEFVGIFTAWRTMFRENRKAKGFPNLETLAKRTGLAEATLRAIETGHRVPSEITMKTLLDTQELGLEPTHIFVQIVLNRVTPRSSG